MSVNELFQRGIYVLQKEGLGSFLGQFFSYLTGFFYRRGSYYIYEKPLSKKEQFTFTSKLAKVEVKIITTLEEFKQLGSKGYDFKAMLFKERLKKKAVAFCAFVNKELAHVTWVAFNEEAKNEVDNMPFKLKFQAKEACSGASFTNPKFRGKGLLSYIYAVIFPYLVQRGINKDKYTIKVNNIPSQKAMNKFNHVIIGQGHYLKILWWEFWREEPVKES